MSAPAEQKQEQVRVCRECGCTDADCSGCIERTGAPCWWVELDLCSAHPDPCPVGDPDCAGEVPGEWQCHDGCEPAPESLSVRTCSPFASDGVVTLLNMLGLHPASDPTDTKDPDV